MNLSFRTPMALLFLLTCLSLPVQAGHFSYSLDARTAYDLVLSLRFNEARIVLDRLKSQEPGNLIIHHIENYIDFFTIYINEDEEEYKRLLENREKRLDAVQLGDPESPYYLFVQADIRLQWALARLKFGEYFNAFWEVNKAYKLLQKNQEAFPHFMLNYKDLGILHAMVGTIPDNYKWGVKLLSGLDGTIDQGRSELESVVNYAQTRNDFLFARESAVFYAFLLLHLENKEDEAWQTVVEAGLQPRTNLLHCFVMANIAMRSGRNDTAIKILQERPRGKGFFPFHYLDFMLGTAKLRRLDKDADLPLLSYVQTFKGKNFIKEAYQKLAWHALIHSGENAYQHYMDACLMNGNLIVDSDKSAQMEAEEGVRPEVSLLKARMLFDGGYFQKAHGILSVKSVNDFNTQRTQLEFLYRFGRILHGMERFPQALQYYQQTIDRGSSSPYYYSCNAALQCGLICEELGQPDKAIGYFETCLSLRPEEFRLGLHQKAKSGLSRIRDGQDP